MKKVAFCTLGCKVNQYETEAMIERFEDSGYLSVNFDEVADVYVINTCTVTGMSARKSRQMIRKAKILNADAVIAVVGCYPQVSPEEVGNIEGVDIIIGTKDRGRLPEFVESYKKQGMKINNVTNIMNSENFEELNIKKYKGRTRAFIKIQDGCSQFCSYCIIPYARGPVRSRRPEDIINEVERFVEQGFVEVVLTGIHIASYGKDLQNITLLDLIEKIHEVQGIRRIRLGSIEPSIVTEEFAVIAGKLNKLCPHYHISLQSGCDATLKRMNRKYTTDEYRKVVKLLRENVKDISITTDVMVGFPGETDEEFEVTYQFIKEMQFSQMHVFKFSPRKGTHAALMTDQVEAALKEERSSKLLELSIWNIVEFNNKYINMTLPVLFEQDVKTIKEFYEGLTPNYIRVLCKGDDNVKGNIYNVKLNSIEGDYVLGELMD